MNDQKFIYQKHTEINLYKFFKKNYFESKILSKFQIFPFQKPR